MSSIHYKIEKSCIWMTPPQTVSSFFLYFDQHNFIYIIPRLDTLLLSLNSQSSLYLTTSAIKAAPNYTSMNVKTIS